MIKIEQLKDGAKVFVTRDGNRCQVYLNQLISHQEFKTVEVEGGTLVYSVDEIEVKEMVRQGKQLEIEFTETVTDKVVAKETSEIETTTVATPITKPAIVIPPPRVRK